MSFGIEWIIGAEDVQAEVKCWPGKARFRMGKVR